MRKHSRHSTKLFDFLLFSPNFVCTSSEKKGSRDEIVIATKFAAYPWRLTPGQFVDACR